jgi:hypothetical protein
VASTLVVVLVVGQSSRLVSAEEAECPNECCASAVSCGKGLSLCSSEQEGEACNGCDGTTKVRVCKSCTQERQCTAKEGDATTCGETFTGTCTEATLGYFYCKKTAAGGDHSCSVDDECTGDTACPAED